MVLTLFFCIIPITGKLKIFVAFRWLQNEKVPAVVAARVQAVQNKLKRKRRKRKKKSSKVKCLYRSSLFLKLC